MRRWVSWVAVMTAVLATAVGGQAASGAPYDDPLLPGYGDTTIDLTSYRVAIDWTPGTGAIEATARISALMTRSANQIELDLSGLTVDDVLVGQTPVVFTRTGHRLAITLPAALGQGDRLELTVRYHGVPEPIRDPDDSLEGWGPTADGALALGEPVGTMTWLPISNVPSDKTPMSIAVTAPHGFEVAANGRLVHRDRHGAKRTWRYSVTTMAPYLAMVAIGQFDLHRARTRSGVHVLSFTDPTMGDLSHQVGLVPTAVEWLTRRIGTPYPFGQAGIVVDPNPYGYALETQTRPVFPHVPGDLTLVHELAHQWFGDSVTLQQWDDIWLNEGFATYLEWCWMARQGRSTPAAEFARRYRGHRHDPDFWSPAPHRLGTAANLFTYHAVYLRGAMTLQALRESVGGDTFWWIVRRWATSYADGNATTEEFERLAERVSGRDLHVLFRDWLDRPVRPQGYARR